MSFLTLNSDFEVNVASSVASVTSRCILQPLDVIKIRLQLQEYSNKVSFKMYILK